MKKIRVGINGFGRIGRIATRIILERSNLEIAAINSKADSTSHAYLLKYDTTYGTLSQKIEARNNHLYIDNKKVTVFQKEKPHEIPWHDEDIDIVVDSTGKFRNSADLEAHLQKGAKYVVLSAPAKDNTKTLIMGVNHNLFDPKKDNIVSNSSCTTNCLATTLKVVHDNFKVVNGFMTTVHAVTDSQNILDNSHKKEVRLRRAAFASMIPAATGSAKDIGKLFPELSGKLLCQAIRIPLLTVSLINLVVELRYQTTKEEINRAYEAASQSNLKGILDVASEELVSRDYLGHPYSSIVDPFLTQTSGKLANIYAWYDNEWGYASRLVDLVEHVGKKAGLI